MSLDRARGVSPLAACLLAAALAGACSATPAATAPPAAHPTTAAHPTAHPTALPSGARTVPVVAIPRRFRDPLPGMPPVVGGDVYTGAGAGRLAAATRGDPARVYVPDSSPGGTTVTVISQRTRRVVRTIHVGHLTQHVIPSYDLRHLYASSSESNELVAIDPRTGRAEHRLAVPRPYNLYFTPDGRQAVVMVEERDVIRFADPHTFAKRRDVHVRGCRGPNHADFSANGRYLLVSCEFSGSLVKIATASHRVLGVLRLGRAGKPQDVRLSPDGTTFYVADMGVDRVRLVSAARLRQLGSIRTPGGPHGLYPSRDGRLLYVSERDAGKVGVVSFATRRVVHTWTVPGGGSPDMGGVSADGRTLWLSGRYNSEVYAFDTRSGRLVARIPVPGSPHGLCVWPQPGRYSLGHTGNMR
jgi:DNA-binding beta-propeller fold protein YncE